MKAQLFKQDKIELPTKSLRSRYLVPPFSILDTTVGSWLSARNDWENLIKNRANNIRNELARTNTPYRNPMDYDEGYKGLERNGSTSTFDPFLCEILVKWFSRLGDTIYDPFAGGHVRGVVASILGRNYVGIDINDKQIEANYENLHGLYEVYRPSDEGSIDWICGDSASDSWKYDGKKFNMLLTCPPYYNLEIYTDKDGDLSTKRSYDEFFDVYSHIIQLGFDRLEDDSFAVIVVEELRNKETGLFYGFVPDTINAFEKAGFQYYNELILANRIMSLGVRCPKYFDQSRKVGRHHQNVLVFYKGNANPNIIHEKFGDFEK